MHETPKSTPFWRKPTVVRIAVWSAMAAIAVASVWIGLRLRGERERNDAVRIAHLRAILSGSIPSWLPGEGAYRRRVWAEVAQAYRRNGLRPLWSSDGEPTASAHAFLKALADAPRDGLEPAAYAEPELRENVAAKPVTRSKGPYAEAARIARLDTRLTAAFVRFARELREGRMPPGSLDPDWLALRDTLDVGAALTRAVHSVRAARMVADLGRTDRAYRGLRDAIRDYRRIEARGGWPVIPPGDTPKFGSREERFRLLRSRLLLTGDVRDPRGADVYDVALANGVRNYQARTGLDVTGRLDEETRKSLNVSVAERRRTLELNLERVRWLPEVLPDPILRVNIPESQLRVVEKGGESLAMRAVVGAPTDPTPVFADIITYVEFHPTWGVPKKILTNEMLPKFEQDEGFFLANNIRVFDIAFEIPLEVDPRDVPWERVEEDSFPYVVRQDAGPQNPLGQIKFMCPNEYDVYLHDTPARRHFERGSRFLSHGCVRVQDPMMLAEYLLKETTVEAPDSLSAIMADSLWRRVGLKRRVPVLVEYRTAWVDEAGTVHFRPDVYGLDRRLAAALESGKLAGFDLNPKVLRNTWMPSTSDWSGLRKKR